MHCILSLNGCLPIALDISLGHGLFLNDKTLIPRGLGPIYCCLWGAVECRDLHLRAKNNSQSEFNVYGVYLLLNYVL